MKKVSNWLIVSIMAILLALFVVFIDKFHLPSENISDGISAIISSFIGILFTISATAILINSQSMAEKKKEKDMMQFSKKQESYRSFLVQLEDSILVLLSRSINGNDARKFENIDSLSKVIFELGNIRTHMSEDIFKRVMDKVSTIFKVYRESQLSQTYKSEIERLSTENKTKSVRLNTILYRLFEAVAINLLDISDILHNDLYDEVKDQSRSEDNIKIYISNLLNNCGLEDNECKQPFN